MRQRTITANRIFKKKRAQWNLENIIVEIQHSNGKQDSFVFSESEIIN